MSVRVGTHAAIHTRYTHVQDPMNLGAILRCAFYLGVDRVIVTAKNWLVVVSLPMLIMRWLEPCTPSLLWLRSCPLTPIVSKASSGAMEWMRVHSVKDMAKFFIVCSWSAVGAVFTFSGIIISVIPTPPFLLPFPSLCPTLIPSLYFHHCPLSLHFAPSNTTILSPVTSLDSSFLLPPSTFLVRLPKRVAGLWWALASQQLQKMCTPKHRSLTVPSTTWSHPHYSS